MLAKAVFAQVACPLFLCSSVSVGAYGERGGGLGDPCQTGAARLYCNRRGSTWGRLQQSKGAVLLGRPCVQRCFLTRLHSARLSAFVLGRGSACCGGEAILSEVLLDLLRPYRWVVSGGRFGW